MSNDISDHDVPDRTPSAAAPALAGKRPRRMRSDKGFHYGNGQKGKKGPGAPNVELLDKKNATPIFLQKTYEMINTCDPNLGSWNEDGTMFIIKDQKQFETLIIPQFFDHKKFSSFARQLNFYGFRKMQSRAIYKNDINKETEKHITFFNEKFQRGKPELLREIQRTTKGGQNTCSQQEHQKEIDMLTNKVACLENVISQMQNEFNYRLAAVQTQIQQVISYSNPDKPTVLPEPIAASQTIRQPPVSLEAINAERPKLDNDLDGFSFRYLSTSSLGLGDPVQSNNMERPTLAPHPNSKVLPNSNNLPALPTRSMRGNTLDNFSFRNLSTFSLGLGDDMANAPPLE